MFVNVSISYYSNLLKVVKYIHTSKFKVQKSLFKKKTIIWVVIRVIVLMFFIFKFNLCKIKSDSNSVFVICQCQQFLNISWKNIYVLVPCIFQALKNKKGDFEQIAKHRPP